MPVSRTSPSVAGFAGRLLALIDADSAAGILPRDMTSTADAAAGILPRDMTSVADLYHAVGFSRANGYVARAGLTLSDESEHGWPCQCDYHAGCAEVDRRLCARATRRGNDLSAGWRRGRADAAANSAADISRRSRTYQLSYASARQPAFASL